MKAAGQCAAALRALRSAAASVAIALLAVGIAVVAPAARGTRAGADAPSMPYELATIAATSYPIPPGAVFVANWGSDRNPGTVGAPFATISHALAATPTGGTIVVRGGVYRESLGTITRRVTIQAYPNEQPWVKGSVVATLFSQGANGWATPFTTRMCDNCYPSAALASGFPAAGLPEQVFVDGAPLRQVTSLTALDSGSFYAEPRWGRLWIGANPLGHTVEITVRGSAFSIAPSAAGTVIRGLGFEHWAAVYQGSPYAAATSSARFVTFDADTFAWSAGRGLGIYGDNDVVTNSKFLDNGMNGLHANRVTGLDFERNEVAYSNFEHWDITPSPFAQIAGAKLTGVAYTMMRNNDFHDNDSNGLWFDQLSHGQTIIGNTIVRNAGHGLTVEVSGQSMIAGNVVADNGRDGLKISGANDVAVWNNTSVGNGWAQIGVYEDPRHTTGIVTSDTSNVSILNNVFAAGPDAQKPLFFVIDTSSPKHATLATMVSADDHNVWGDTGGHEEFDVQMTLDQSASYLGLSQFRAATGRENNSTSVDGIPLQSLFTDPLDGDFSLSPLALPHLASPAVPPVSVAWAMGGFAAVPTHVGA